MNEMNAEYTMSLPIAIIGLLLLLLFVNYFYLKKRYAILLEKTIAQRTAVIRAELETKRKSLQDDLKLSELRIDKVLHNSADAIITINQAGLIESFNKAACDIFGYTKHQILGQNIKLLMPESYRLLHDEGMKHFLTKGEPKIIGQIVEVEGLHKSGTIIQIELTVDAFKWKQNIKFTGIARDITERKMQQQMLINANNAKSEFLSLMSHELHTPLNAVLGFAQLLANDRSEPLSNDQQESIQHIISAGQHLVELVNDLLQLSRIENKNIKITSESVPIADIFNDCLPTLQNMAQAHNISINIETTPNFAVCADRAKLKQVLINLISNAIKYNKVGGSVTISCSIEDNQYKRTTISDTGIGIPDHKHDQLFTAFNRLGQENSSIEGSGIGLVVTKRLVEMMNGRIGFNVIEGQGSAFWFDLPFDADELNHLITEHSDVTIT